MFFVVVGVFCLLFGGLLLYSKLDRQKNAKPYMARLIGMESKWVKRGSVLRQVYRAEISYKTDTIDRRAHHHEFVYYNDHAERFGIKGEFVAFIDPRISDVFYFPQEMKGKVGFGALAAFMIGAFFIIVGIILASRGM